MRPFFSAILIALAIQPSLGTSLWAEPSGAYLAARQARYDYNFEAASRYFTQALVKDFQNQAILEQAVVSLVSLGDFERALPIARKMDAAELESSVSQIVLIADLAKEENFQELIARVDNGQGIGEFGNGLLKAWSLVDLGDMLAALALFDDISKKPGMRDFALYHKAIAVATVGDFEATVNILSGKAAGDVQYTRQGVIAWVQALSQLGRADEAKKLISNIFGSSPPTDIQTLYDQLGDTKPVPFSVVHTAREGVAEVFYSLGQALSDGSGNDYALIMSRSAEYINPENTGATLMSAELLASLERYALAAETYQKVTRDHPLYQTAELGRAQALDNDGKTGAAIEVLTNLSQTYPDAPIVSVSLGDLYRQHERFKEAIPAYDKAIELYQANNDVPWFAYYSRAVSLERTGQWDGAQADFRAALKINPDQPQVLNYLGYSMVEKKLNYDEALNLIERAVELEPDSGYIVDSLGWVQYRLGRFEDAARNLERAAELMPVDPVVNDHLGDAMWMVGRKNEAEFQWKRALSFIDPENPSPDINPDRIREKLAVGLDEVLNNEKNN